MIVTTSQPYLYTSSNLVERDWFADSQRYRLTFQTAAWQICLGDLWGAVE